MNREEGNTAYIAIAVVVFVVGVVAALLGYVKAERTSAFAAGEKAERGRWLERDNENARKMGAALVNLQQLVRAREAQAAEDLAKLAAKHLKEKADAQAARDRFMDDLVAGRVRFFDPGRAAGAGSGGGGAKAPAAAPGGNGPAQGELSAAAAGFLHGEATRADAVVAQLWLAQQTIITYREACR